MTLTTHALVGTTAASLFVASPSLALVAAFLSHLAIDSLPHRDYQLSSIVEGEQKIDTDMTLGKAFVGDLVRTGADSLLGLTLSYLIFAVWLFHFPLWLVLVGVVGGLLPDFLQLVFFKSRTILLLPLQRFHIWIQIGRTLEVPFFVGACLQIVLVAVLIGLRLLVLHLYTV